MREILTGRVGGEPEFGTAKNSKGVEFRTCNFTLFVADPFSESKNKKQGNEKKWNDFPRQIKASGPIVDTIEELMKSGELASGKVVSVLGKYRVDEFEKDGKHERREYLQPEKFDTTTQLEKEHNALLKAYAKGQIDSLSKGLVDEFPSIDQAEEIEKETEYDIEKSEEAAIDR